MKPRIVGAERASHQQQPQAQTTSLAEWRDRIARTWAKQITAILETGRLLIEAKASLPHGEFLRLRLPFHHNTAERLMAIARHPVLADSTHAHTLPPAWTTLYELSRLPPDYVISRILTGEINPALERYQAEGMVSNWRTPPRPSREIFVEPVLAPDSSGPGKVVPAVLEGIAAQASEILEPQPRLDSTTPTGTLTPVLVAVAAEATKIVEPLEPSLDRLAILIGAWNAASHDDRKRFVAHRAVAALMPIGDGDTPRER